MDGENEVSETIPLEANGTNNKQESEHEEADEKTEEILDMTLLCGWGKWRPKFLQPLSRPSVFLVVLVVYAMTAGIVAGLTGVNLPDIEKEFGFSSKKSAVILLANDIGGILMLPFVSFYGTHAKKPKWIGIGAIITGIGALLMILPKVLIGNYSIPGLTNKGSNLCNIGLDGQSALAASCSGAQGYGSTDKYLALFCLAQVVIGLGVTPVWPLSPVYLDENVNPKMSPIYLGVWFVSVFLGRGMGYAIGGSFSRFFTNLALPAGLTLSREDPRWIGAWWLGFFVFAWFAIIPGVFLICFPREMPKYRKKRLEAMDAGKLPPANKEIGKGLKGLLRSLIDLLKNKTYVFSCLGLTVKIIFAAALGGFYTKIIVLKFGGSLSQVSLLSAAVFIPANTLGVGIGSFIMKRLSIANSPKRASQYLIMTGVVLTIFSSVWLLPGCKSTNIVGAAIPYPKSNEIGRITSQCNSGCGCSRRSYEPMCGKDGYTYFSPCFAGCQSKVEGGASNCTCVTNGISSNQETPTSHNSTYAATSGNNASITEGRCDRNCKNLALFLTLCALNLMVSFSGSIPQKMLTLRCVADNQRAFGLGMQIMFLRLLSFVPGPLILGSIIDSSCLLWGKDDCGNQGNCLEYDVDKLSKHFFTFAIIAAISATIMYFLAWYFYIPQQIVLDEKQQNNNENADLIEDTKEKA